MHLFDADDDPIAKREREEAAVAPVPAQDSN